MIEIQEIGRLYPAKGGFRLIVGEMNSALDWERTAALAYHHDTDMEHGMHIADTMSELKSKLELCELSNLTSLGRVVKKLMGVWRETAEGNTKAFFICGETLEHEEIKPTIAVTDKEGLV